MNKKPLPTKLGREPLIDVVCGVKFKSQHPAENLLPGLVVPVLKDKPFKIESLPAGQLPHELRASDPALQNVPLVRIVVGGEFVVLIGSNTLLVGCQLPYPGWDKFREMIMAVFGILKNAPFITEIESHSLKYVDVIPSKSAAENSLSRFNLAITLGERCITSQPTHLRTEIADNNFTHIVNIVSHAKIQLNSGTPKDGSVIDVDTHHLQSMGKIEFTNQMATLLDQMHQANKELFFSLFSESGLAELEPVYASN